MTATAIPKRSDSAGSSPVSSFASVQSDQPSVLSGRKMYAAPESVTLSWSCRYAPTIAALVHYPLHVTPQPPGKVADGPAG